MGHAGARLYTLGPFVLALFTLDMNPIDLVPSAVSLLDSKNMEIGDLLFVLLYIVIAWKLMDDSDEGGRRSRIPIQ
jgi:hypothetical protein